MKSTGIFILNVARSGSSVLAGVLDKLGVYGGSDLVKPNIFNPKGFYESEDIINIHGAIGRVWDKLDPSRTNLMGPPENWHTSGEIAEVKNKLRNLLKISYLTKELWYLKEPMLMRLLPLYYDLQEELGFDIKVCFMYRHPLEVAYSMHDYNRQDINANVFSWIKYNLEAEIASRKSLRTFIGFDSILSDWRSSVNKMKKSLNINIQLTNDVHAGLLVNPIYRDYTVTDFEDISNETLAEFASKIFGALQSFENESSEGGIASAVKTFDEVNAKVLEVENNAKIVNGKKSISLPGKTVRKISDAITPIDVLPLMFKNSVLYMEPERLTDVYSWHAHIPFAFWLVENLKPGSIVEVGVQKGDAYFAFCQALKYCGLDGRAKCLGIETYRPPAPTAAAANDAGAGNKVNMPVLSAQDVYGEVAKYNKKYEGFSSVIMPPDASNGINITMETVSAVYPDIKKIDLLHFNGFGSYETIKSNFENLEPYLSENAVVLIHLILPRIENITVWKFFEEIAQKYPSFTLNIDFGLGVLLTGKEAQRHPSISKFVLPAFSHAVHIFNDAGIKLAKKRDKRRRTDLAGTKETAQNTETLVLSADEKSNYEKIKEKTANMEKGGDTL